ncbi:MULTISPECIES: hypothetical protein [Aliiglaciecola]|uniref:hypothetical protein n=1 Tax=Aliiglaciecola TaxID=1406885 RepID=UPI001C0A25D1|nr:MULTISPECIES: hypothetical protein [Aliiglaciecola]MBU2878433.1 hypothetical protein [Aliiglaciecola lipolytica]MDO6711761.1 hypothetical protein [Aliiglaciecola sp. 2_MG-2023]MDO6752832.1 hypothetical protein [Aliiglaciecola sp. 1_MG-2023]
MKLKACLIFGFFVPFTSQAHEVEGIAARPDSVEVRTAITYRSEDAFSDTEIWQFPGVLLGGEALPVEKGVTLDDVQLLGHLNIKDDYFISTKVGAHSHSGESELELENLWFGTRSSIAGQPLLFEVGKMATEVTLTANFHASDDVFSEAPLLADVFFGRHSRDLGARARIRLMGIDFGAELWNGDNWPATSGEGAAALFAHYQYEHDGINATLGSWLMHSRAENRVDERYSDGHSHGDQDLTASDLSFSGDTTMVGAFANLEWQLNPITLHADVEWIRADFDADLADTTQTAVLDATQDGYKFQVGVSLDNHTLQAKYERLVVDNRFTETSQTFIQQSGLFNNDHEPAKAAVAWIWQFHQDFRFRTEWYQDDTQEEGVSRWSVGLVWHYKLL